METIYVSGEKTVYDMTRFWGKLFGINFALGGYRPRPWSFSSGLTDALYLTMWAIFSARRWRWSVTGLLSRIHFCRPVLFFRLAAAE